MKAEELLKKLTLKEKIGQMLQLTGQLNPNNPDTPYTISKEYIELRGSVIDVQARDYETKIPVAYMADVIHGYRTIFPIPLAIGCSFDESLMEKAAEIASKEATDCGVNVTFAPMVDLVRDARWGRVMESTGEDPFLNENMAKAAVRGFHKGGKNGRLASCVKHYAAYGGAEAGRDYNTVDMSDYRFYDQYLRGYKACVEEGVDMVMTSFNSYDGVPATVNKKLMKDVLRDELKFDGVLITDYAAIYETMLHATTDSDKDAAIKSVNVGVDIDMCSYIYSDALFEAVTEGKVKEEVIDECCLRVLKLKEKLGLLDENYERKFINLDFALPKEHRKVAEEIADKCAVLLENDGTLPLSGKEKIALVGPFGNTGSIIGAWSCVGKDEEATTVYSAMKDKFSSVYYSEGVDWKLDAKYSKDENMLKEISKYDVVVLAIGEHQSYSGEGRSRATLNIPTAQLELYNDVRKVAKKVVVLLFTGRPLELGSIRSANAILNMWQSGTEGGKSAVNLLTGDSLPSGRLTMSFPVSVGQCPIYYNHFNTGRPAKYDGEPFRSDYIDCPTNPLYPFGYGLTYGKIEYSKVALSGKTLDYSGSIKASVNVKNVGEYLAEETVQLYIRDNVGSRVRPVKELKGYKKVKLQPNESKTVEFEINAKMLEYYTINNKFEAERGEFTVYIGKDSSVSEGKIFSLE